MKYLTDTNKKLIAGVALFGALYFGYNAFNDASRMWLSKHQRQKLRKRLILRPHLHRQF